MTKSCKNCDWATKDALCCQCPLPAWINKHHGLLTELEHDLAESCYYYKPKSLDKPTACFDCDHFTGVDCGTPYCDHGPLVFDSLRGEYKRQRICVWQKNTNGKCPDFTPKCKRAWEQEQEED